MRFNEGGNKFHRECGHIVVFQVKLICDIRLRDQHQLPARTPLARWASARLSSHMPATSPSTQSRGATRT